MRGLDLHTEESIQQSQHYLPKAPASNLFLERQLLPKMKRARNEEGAGSTGHSVGTSVKLRDGRQQLGNHIVPRREIRETPSPSVLFPAPTPPPHVTAFTTWSTATTPSCLSFLLLNMRAFFDTFSSAKGR